MDIFSTDRWRQISRVAWGLGATKWQTDKWRVRRRIPGEWHLRLLRACLDAGVSLSVDELLSTTSESNGRSAA